MIGWLALAVALVLLAVLLYDFLQKENAVRRNYPLVGRLRELGRKVGPPLRQYIVAQNNEERPFSRDQRKWVYSSSRQTNNYFGFGTDNDLERASNYLILRHSAFPLDPKPKESAGPHLYEIPCAKVLGAARERRQVFRPASLVNISAMSFGSLSWAAVEAMNRGAKIAGCLHNTGEGGISPYHKRGGELIFQMGTGYFGCRDEQGGFSMESLLRTLEGAPVRAIEIKLSQGAKPGLGGVLPKEKITEEISNIRGIPMGKDCISPAGHSAFSDVSSLLDFVESLAETTGLPVGIKSAVGQLNFWRELAEIMQKDPGRGVDYIAIDGGEGGTGAGPLAFTDHVALPFKLGMAEVYRIFKAAELTDRVIFVGAGRLGFPERAVLAMALGCDLIAVAREPMMAIGCIQAQECHTGHCPTGVATQRQRFVRGLDPTSKADRLANYFFILRKELLRLSHACGVEHPALIGPEHLEILDDQLSSRPMAQVFGYGDDWGYPSLEDRNAIVEIMST